MTEVTNPIVQAVHDAIEAAIAATATELSQAVGFVGRRPPIKSVIASSS